MPYHIFIAMLAVIIQNVAFAEGHIFITMLGVVILSITFTASSAFPSDFEAN